MFEYALEFYSNYTVIFYILLIIAVILEGPITILALSLVAPKLGIGFFIILLFSFLGDFLGDVLHYIVGRFFKNSLIKKEFEFISKFKLKIEKYSMLDKLILIKYTPPITSIGLLFLGYSKIDFIKFIKSDVILCIVSSLFITIIGYNFGNLFRDNIDFSYFIIILFLVILIFFYSIRVFGKIIIKKVNEKNT